MGYFKILHRTLFFAKFWVMIMLEALEEKIGFRHVFCFAHESFADQKYAFCYLCNDQSPSPQENIHFVTERVPNDISSTRIRRCVQRGESVRFLVPDAVIDYINANNLYRNISKDSKNEEIK